MAGLTGGEEKGPNPGRCGEMSRLLTSDRDQQYTRIKSECVWRSAMAQRIRVFTHSLPVYLLRKLKAFARRCCGINRCSQCRVWVVASAAPAVRGWPSTPGSEAIASAGR